MKLQVRKNPHAGSLAECREVADDAIAEPGTEIMTREQYEAYLAAEIAAGWAPISAAPAPLPAVVTSRQFKLALLRGGLYQAVLDIVSAADPETQITWHNAQVFERTHPMIGTMATVMGKSTEEVDELFRLAATL